MSFYPFPLLFNNNTNTEKFKWHRKKKIVGVKNVQCQWYEFDLIFVTILLTIVLVIFAEVIPKTYAFSHSDQVALTVAPIINFFIFLLTPATFITERFAKIVSGPLINDE